MSNNKSKESEKPKLTPKEINEALKALESDDLRSEAMSGICRCGAVTDGDRCWGCYDSPGDYD